MTKFGESQPKREGDAISFDIGDMNVRFPVRPEFANPETTYVERRVPIELEDELHEYIDSWLKDRGFDPEEL